MPFPLLGLALGAIGGLGKYAMAKGRENAEREAQAATTANAAWTGLKGKEPTKANLIGDVLQFATAGAGLEQAAGRSALEEDYMKAVTDRIKAGASPASFSAPASFWPSVGRTSSWSNIPRLERDNIPYIDEY